MRRKSFADMSCSVAQTLEVVGDRWTLLVIRDCFLGVTRFDVFEERLGIARNVLAQRLDHLVEVGVLDRVPYQERPVRYDYKLTEKGRDLWQVVTALRQWGDRWAAPDGPPLELVHTSCGHTTTLVPQCSECGEAVTRRDVRPQPGPGAHDLRLAPVTRA